MVLILAGVFAATVLLVVATHHFVMRQRLASNDLVRQRLSPLTAPPASVVPILKDLRASQLEFLNRALSGKSLTAAINCEIERAGSSQTVGTFVLTSALLGFIGGFLGQRLAGPMIGLALGVLGCTTPLFYLRWKQGRRVKAFETQLPDAIDMLVNAMKAGYSLPAAIKFIGEEVPAPLGPIFARFYDEQRLGVAVRVALGNMRQRMDTLDMRMFITSLLIQRETGGNLAEIMTNLSSLMRERVGIRGQIETLTAEPKLSAIVLAVLPVSLFFIFNLLNRDYIAPLYTTPGGRLLLLYGIVSTVVGYLILRRMGSIDI